ncbi:hemolysin family protein [Porphyromonadaceae bacterium W3.11]|nr:hemolysin family protein [Porphyromonadaceae bacterium W3.11]
MLYLAIILCVLFSAFFSMSEISFVSADRLQVELDKSQGSTVSKIQAYFYKRMGKFITTILIGNNIINVVYGLCFAMVLEAPLSKVIPNDFLVMLIQTMISTAIVIVFGEYLPKSIGQLKPNTTLKVLSFPLMIIYILLLPVTILVSALSSLSFKILGVKNEEDTVQPLSKVDLDYYIETNVTQEEKASEAKILQNAIEFSEVKVRDCYIPRNEIRAVDSATPLDELIALFDKTGYSKILVYNEDIDDIIGYIHGIEMYKVESEGSLWQNHIHPTLYVPESLGADRIMKKLLNEKMSIAVVVDELGGTAGIITLEDIVEEIFGDIEDEHDTNRVVMRQVGEREYIISGRAELDTLNEKFDLDLPEDEDFKTIAGFILYHYQGIPDRGEEFSIAPDFQFKVMRATENKITLVKLKKMES